jgi:hypothetical protein
MWMVSPWCVSFTHHRPFSDSFGSSIWWVTVICCGQWPANLLCYVCVPCICSVIWRSNCHVEGELQDHVSRDILELPYIGESWDSSAGIVIRLWVGQSTFWILVEARDFFVSKPCKPALRLMQRAVHWLLGTLSVELWWPGCVADCSPPSNIKVKSEWSCTSTSVSLHGVFWDKCLQHLLQEEVFWVNCRLFRLYRENRFTCLHAGTAFSECLNNIVEFILLFECILADIVNVLQCPAVRCAVPAAQAVFNCISGWWSVQQTSILLMVSSITYSC